VGQLTREISAANADGIQGVPLVFIGPKAIYGPIDAAKLRAEIAPFLEGVSLP
jgi:protein-disulfide isomerase